MTLSAAPDYLPPPFHKIFSLTLRSMNSPWRWDYLVVKFPPTLENLKITTNYDFYCPTSLPWQPFPPSPWDNLTDPDKHELSLTVRFSHDKIFYTTIINLDFVCCTWLPPLPLPWDFLADTEKDDLSLTVRLSHGQNLINFEKLDLSFTFIIV